MRLKTFRYWLASKILGGLIVEETKYNEEIETAKHNFIKEQLAHGNSVTLEYKITHIEDHKKKSA